MGLSGEIPELAGLRYQMGHGGIEIGDSEPHGGEEPQLDEGLREDLRTQWRGEAWRESKGRKRGQGVEDSRTYCLMRWGLTFNAARGIRSQFPTRPSLSTRTLAPMQKRELPENQGGRAVARDHKRGAGSVGGGRGAGPGAGRTVREKTRDWHAPAGERKGSPMRSAERRGGAYAPPKSGTGRLGPS